MLGHLLIDMSVNAAVLGFLLLALCLPLGFIGWALLPS